jgi:F0F1-type ATP synthase assembly protein I
MSDESGAGGDASGKDGAPKAGERSPWALAGLGVQFFAALVLFVYAGSWMDSRFDTSPLFLLLGLFGGGGGSFFLSYRRLMSDGK